MTSKTKDWFKEDSFNLKKYIDDELQDAIKLVNANSSNEYLEKILETIKDKKSELEKSSQKFVQKDSKEMTNARESQTYKAVKILIDEFAVIKNTLSQEKSQINDQIKMTKMVKRKIDKLFKEKEKINSEIFVLDLIKDMKINDNSEQKIAKIEDKIKFANNIKELDNLISMYEKSLIPKLNNLVSKVEEEFISRVELEINKKKYEYTPFIIQYFRNQEKETLIFEIFCQNFILKVNFASITNAFNSQNIQNISLIFDNYFSVLDIFFDKASNKDTHFIKFLDEMLFNKFTGYFFEKYVGRYLEIILMKNLRSNNQFFLEYLEQIYSLFQNLDLKFRNTEKYSVLLQELLQVYKYSCLVNYYEEYFIVEERYFIYCHGIYLNLLKDKMNAVFVSKKINQFESILEILTSDKLEEYLKFMSKSLHRVSILSDQSSLSNNIVKLLKISLSEFKTFLDYVIENLIKSIPTTEPVSISTPAFKISEFLYLMVNRIYVTQKEYLLMIQSSIYFAEIETLKRGVFDSIKQRLIELNAKTIDNVYIIISSNLVINEKDKKVALENMSFIEKSVSVSARFIQEIDNFSNHDFKKMTQVLFFKRLIVLFEENIFKMDKKQVSKMNFSNDFKIFSGIFDKLDFEELKGDKLAFNRLLVCLKTNEKDILKVLDKKEREFVSNDKIEKYNTFFSKLK